MYIPIHKTKPYTQTNIHSFSIVLEEVYGHGEWKERVIVQNSLQILFDRNRIIAIPSSRLGF